MTPVPAAHVGTDPDRSPAREETLRLLACLTDSGCGAIPTRLACRPNVGSVSCASRLPGCPTTT